jgi:hypothetical protein
MFKNLPTDVAFTDSPDADNHINTSLKNWILIGAASLILLVTSWLFIIPFTIRLILLSIQFGILVISIIYYQKTLKLKKQSDKVSVRQCRVAEVK